jgi:hypothetical protein
METAFHYSGRLNRTSLAARALILFPGLRLRITFSTVEA